MRSTEKNIFGGHNKVRLFTERFAQKEMLSMLEFVARARFMDETSLMIVIKDAVPEDIHFSAVGLSDLMGDYLEDLANEHMRRTSKSVSVTALDFIKDCYLEGKQPVMGVAELAEGGNKSSGNTVSGGGGDDDAPQIILYEGLAALPLVRTIPTTSYTGQSFVNDNSALWQTIDQHRKNYRHKIAHSSINPDTAEQYRCS